MLPCVEINQASDASWVIPGDDAAVLAPSSGEEPGIARLEQISRRWRGGRASIQRRKILISTRCYPRPESYITIDYTGFLPNGQVFDSTEKKGGKPLSFRLGERQVVPGIEQVVAQMKPGEEVQALLPASLAYGDKGVCTDDGECLIKPGTNLKYFIRLNRVAAAAG